MSRPDPNGTAALSGIANATLSEETYIVLCAAEEGFFLNDLLDVVVDRHQDRVGAYG
jgi:4-hydroxybenzoate polyprenyltransferase